MVVLVKLLGIFIVVFAAIYLVRPDIMKPYIAFWKEGKRLYMGAVLSLLIGIVLLIAASQCVVVWFVALFGILGLIKGILLFVLKQEKITAMLKWWEERPVTFLRIHALIALAIGALLIYAA